MTTSSINSEWNKFEVALLIDSFQNVVQGKMARKEAISALSQRLRSRTAKLGMSISDTYRNENGIDLQMHAIEYALSNGEEGSIKASRLFCEMAELFNNNRTAYQNILAIANIMFPPVASIFTAPQLPENEHISSPSHSISIAAESPKYVNSKIKKILEQKFPNGYRLSSTIETKKLLRYFKEEYGYELNMEMDDIDEDVKTCGIVYETRVYLPELMLINESKTLLVNHINKSFLEGQTGIYYSVLFNEFHDIFLDSKIYDEHLLRDYLESINTFGWLFKPQYLCKEQNAEIDITQEVINFVKSQGTIVSEDQVTEGLSFLPDNLVRQTFNNGRISELISSGRGTKFHIDNFVLSAKEVQQVGEIISQTIQQYHYITYSELLQDIRFQQPQILDNNTVFGDLGLRKVLAKYLGGRFSFINNIISDFNTPFSAYDCFKQLSQREEYTLQDVTTLANDCGTSPNSYFETLFETSCRINENQFISANRLQFETDAIDSILLRFCHKDYISLYGISALSVLPDCGYPWTRFLLESYVFRHSKLFKLIIHDRFSQQYPVGGIVKRNSTISTFDELATRIIAESDIELTEASCLEYLRKEGYIAMKRYNGIKQVINAARLIRNKKN